jgi:hypothetical protein
MWKGPSVYTAKAHQTVCEINVSALMETYTMAIMHITDWLMSTTVPRPQV